MKCNVCSGTGAVVVDASPVVRLQRAGSVSVMAGTDLEREIDSLFEEWWEKERPMAVFAKSAVKGAFIIGFLAGREPQIKQPAPTPNAGHMRAGGTEGVQ